MTNVISFWKCAGTGGDEAALFAGDLLRMYLRYAESQGWQTEIVSASASEQGGYKSVVARIGGQAVYARLKFESGGHRVQRISSYGILVGESIPQLVPWRFYLKWMRLLRKRSIHKTCVLIPTVQVELVGST